eukprot:1151154-Pelagomonas_calceolata.AAC.1
MTHFGSGGARELRKVPCDRPSKWPSYSPLEDAIGKNWPTRPQVFCPRPGKFPSESFQVAQSSSWLCECLCTNDDLRTWRQAVCGVIAYIENILEWRFANFAAWLTWSAKVSLMPRTNSLAMPTALFSSSTSPSASKKEQSFGSRCPVYREDVPLSPVRV